MITNGRFRVMWREENHPLRGWMQVLNVELGDAWLEREFRPDVDRAEMERRYLSDMERKLDEMKAKA